METFDWEGKIQNYIFILQYKISFEKDKKTLFSGVRNCFSLYHFRVKKIMNLERYYNNY